jgi:beta-glucosidase/6-phospho-beta-glucosidase/beta-galactosidase
VDAYGRYLTGYFPPNLRCRFSRGARFLLNMLRAHCQVYEELKNIVAQGQAQDIKIGISHQYLIFYPTHFLMRPVANVLNKFNLAVLNFFKTSRFKCKIPLICNVVANSHSKPKTDFVGVQFYGRIFLGLKGVDPVNKLVTTMPGVYEDPEGLYEAIVTCFDAFNVPVIISENGISTQSDEQRARYMTRALYAAEQAGLKIGTHNILGYVMWSFCDNFEWFLGWTAHFGAFGLTPERVLKDNYKLGITPFIEKIKAWSLTLADEAK